MSIYFLILFLFYFCLLSFICLEYYIQKISATQPPQTMIQTDMLTCPFGNALYRRHTVTTVTTDRNERQTCREGQPSCGTAALQI